MFSIVNTCFIWRLISILRFAVFILNFIPKPIRRISLTPEFTTQLHRESCLDSVLIKTFSVFFYWSCQSLKMTLLRFALKPLVKYFKTYPPHPPPIGIYDSFYFGDGGFSRQKKIDRGRRKILKHIFILMDLLKAFS